MQGTHLHQHEINNTSDNYCLSTPVFSKKKTFTDAGIFFFAVC